MVNRIWLLTALVGSVLICDASALLCSQCIDLEENYSCGKGTHDTQVECTGTCYIKNIGDKIERGCLINPDPECNTVEGGSCFTCDTDNCNNTPWLKCHQCTGNDVDCITESSAEKYCNKYVEKNECYAKADKTTETVTRGCTSDDDDANCTDNKFCDVCSIDGCNSHTFENLTTFPKCLTCSSPDVECISGTSPTVECNTREDVCYTRLQDGVLERGCLSALASADQGKCTDETDATCITCDGSEEGCNKQTWLQCHQCKQTDEAKCADGQTADSAPFCKTYGEGNQCYHRLESDSVVRGCKSDLADVDPCAGNRECDSCDENGCNSGAADALRIDDRCMQCTTSVDPDGRCLIGAVATQPCATESEKTCYARINTGGVLQRGCRSDLTAAEIIACTGNMCEICETGKCNAIFPKNRLRCYQCNSESEKTCSDQLTGEPMSSYCEVYRESDQCYTRIANEVFERGCQSDLTEPACNGLGARECATCGGENCNQISEERLKNSAGQLAISSILMISAMVLNYFY